MIHCSSCSVVAFGTEKGQLTKPAATQCFVWEANVVQPNLMMANTELIVDFCISKRLVSWCFLDSRVIFCFQDERKLFCWSSVFEQNMSAFLSFFQLTITAPATFLFCLRSLDCAYRGAWRRLRDEVIFSSSPPNIKIPSLKEWRWLKTTRRAGLGIV